MRNEPIIVEQKIRAPGERIWKAISDREEMRHWYFDITRFWPELGCDFQFNEIKDGEKYVVLCRITNILEKKKLSYSWKYEGVPGYSEVSFELIPADEETIVCLTHTGTESFADTRGAFRKKEFRKMWERIIQRMLKDYAERELINSSVSIHADPACVWEVLTDLDFIAVWMTAMGEGTVAESDWKENSEVIWTNVQGETIAKGVVTVCHPEHYLKVSFPCYDETTCALNPGEDYQIYMLTGISSNQCLLEVECNTFTENSVQIKMFWDRALKKIKQISERIAQEAFVME
ncbi:MAG: SRPBCC domain-containing protein [Tannerellaceae bacterium]|nr:SRPBCC domain-containing protein [Tannerellaceae bacterium]